MHYNVAGCRGGFDDLLGEIQAQQPDVVMLNEVQRAQARSMGQALGKAVTFSGRMGHRTANAVLTPGEPSVGRAVPLATGKGMAARSVAIATWGGIEWIVGHLGLDGDERDRHVNIITALAADPVVLTLDCNEGPGGSVQTALAARFTDAGPAAPTYPANDPVSRIDTVWCSPTFTVVERFVMDAGASDHRGVVVDLRA